MSYLWAEAPRASLLVAVDDEEAGCVVELTEPEDRGWQALGSHLHQAASAGSEGRSQHWDGVLSGRTPSPSAVTAAYRVDSNRIVKANCTQILK